MQVLKKACAGIRGLHPVVKILICGAIGLGAGLALAFTNSEPSPSWRAEFLVWLGMPGQARAPTDPQSARTL